MAKEVVFTEQSARRISAAVRRIEQTATGTGAKPSSHRPQQHRRIRFTLTSALALNGSATATERLYDPEAETWTLVGDEVTVHDADGLFSGEIGAVGRAETMSDCGLFEVYQLGCQE